MSYRSAVITPPGAGFGLTQAHVDAMKKAIKEGKKVEMEHSSFSDPGPDWNQVLIDGRVLPGSRTNGY